MSRVIGLTGNKRAGKNTVAKIVADLNREYFVKEASLAGPLKIAAAKLLGVHGTDEYLLKWADTFKESGWIEWGGYVDEDDYGAIKGRELLQRLGTEVCRDLFGDECWIDLLVAEYDYGAQDIFLVTDVRFDNEALAIKEQLFGEVWCVDRPGCESDGHASEAGVSLNLIDRIIYNNGTVSDLRDTVKEALYGA